MVQDAYVQFSETEKFRSANQIDVLYDTIDVDAYEASKKLVSCSRLSRGTPQVAGKPYAGHG